MRQNTLRTRVRGFAPAALLLLLATGASADLRLGPEALVESEGDTIDVPGYSVPSFVDWNEDDLCDLIVGEGGGAPGKVRVYLNVGSAAAPVFSGYFYAQADTADLEEPPVGCLGLFPRVVYWDGDGRKDLVVGRADGGVRLYTNVATDESPAFDAGVFLEVGPPGESVLISVGLRAAPFIVDWNEDGRKDLVVGDRSGYVHLFVNEGSDDAPLFLEGSLVQEDESDLIVPSLRASPHVLDFDHDGRKDLLTGNTNGQLLFYSNVGTDEVPAFSGHTEVESDGTPIDLPGSSRSRPFVCDWNCDGFRDVLIGYGDGLVRIYTGIEHYHDAGVADGGPEPWGVRLLPPRPSPTPGPSVLAFDLERGQAVRLAVYDVSGRRVAWLADRWFGSGRHEVAWSGRDDRGRELPSGVYFARLQAGELSRSHKLILVK